MYLAMYLFWCGEHILAKIDAESLHLGEEAVHLRRRGVVVGVVVRAEEAALTEEALLALALRVGLGVEVGVEVELGDEGARRQRDDASELARSACSWRARACSSPAAPPPPRRTRLYTRAREKMLYDTATTVNWPGTKTTRPRTGSTKTGRGMQSEKESRALSTGPWGSPWRRAFLARRRGGPASWRCKRPPEGRGCARRRSGRRSATPGGVRVS